MAPKGKQKDRRFPSLHSRIAVPQGSAAYSPPATGPDPLLSCLCSPSGRPSAKRNRRPGGTAA